MGSVDLGLSKVCGELKKWAIDNEDEEGLHFGWRCWLFMVVCIYAVWQYREEGIAEGSRSILLKKWCDGDGIVVVGDVGVG